MDEEHRIFLYGAYISLKYLKCVSMPTLPMHDSLHITRTPIPIDDGGQVLRDLTGRVLEASMQLVLQPHTPQAPPETENIRPSSAPAWLDESVNKNTTTFRETYNLPIVSIPPWDSVLAHSGVLSSFTEDTKLKLAQTESLVLENEDTDPGDETECWEEIQSGHEMDVYDAPE